MSIFKNEELRSRLLVEGNDDFHVVSAICKRFAIPGTFEVKDCGGVDKLIEQIPIRIKLRDNYLGIVIDADINLQSRWQQLADLLNPLGYLVAEQPDPMGSITHSRQNDTVIGIWIMPNNQISECWKILRKR